MTRLWMGFALGISLVGCGGSAPFGDDSEPDADTSPGSVYFADDQESLTLNNISFDPDSQTLTINNIPFDDPDNAYDRIDTEKFSNGFDAYQSAPEPGSNELQYFAIFRRSDSGASQVAAAGTEEYIDFGFGGAGAQRLGSRPNLPTTGIYAYNGEYAGVRTTIDARADGGNLVEFTTGDVRLSADFDDFDDIGAVGGTVTNRQLYTNSGELIGALDGFLSLANGEIDRETGSIGLTSAVEINAGGTITGNWRGVFAGRNGSEIAGILFVEGDGVRETGGLITECASASCP